MTIKDDPQHEDTGISPEEKPKGFWRRSGFIISCIIVFAFIAISVLIGGAAVIRMVLKIISIAGGGSLIRGIILAPFFVFGVIQIIRGFSVHIEDAGYDFENKYGKTPKGDFLYTLYFLASIASYFAVALAIYFAAQA